MTNTLKETFWNRIGDARAGMLSTNTADPRPMAHVARAGDNCLWFITADGTDIAQAAKAGETARHVVACEGAQLYGTIDGTLSVETSRDKLDDIWSPMAAAWFDDGKQDHDVCLVGFRPTSAEIWATDGTAKVLYEMAKANLSDARPDAGEHGTVRF